MRVNKIAWSAAILAVTVGLTTPAAPAAAAPAIAVKSDFNADGYNDVAVGMPTYPGYLGTNNSGMIAVLYGGPNGLSDAGQLIRPTTGCSGESAGVCRGWGKGLTSGDVDGDGRTDLVTVGLSERQIFSWTPAGITQQGSSSSAYFQGLTVGNADNDSRPDVVGLFATGWNASFGGWYNGGVFERTPLNAPSSPRLQSTAIGTVNGDDIMEAMVLLAPTYGSTSHELWYIDSLRDPAHTPMLMGNTAACDTPEATKPVCTKKDSQLGLGDVNGDGYRDVVMVTPSTGTVHVWYGSYYGAGMYQPGFTARNLSWLTTLGSTDITVTVGDINGDGRGEIAIGLPRATIAGKAAAGAVALIPGTASGPDVSAARILTQDGIAAPDTAPSADPIAEDSVADDRMGEAVSIIDVTADGKGELIVGVPGKNGGRGMLAVLAGTAAGISSSAQSVHAISTGVSAADARFGAIMLR
ncbi:FG-GAP repeat domain-containing protein [Nonomuraea sp. NPDC049655]|uniref:FG-GAP repeat domain-containing protein n=1 Tax=Nonomuraea sp. NPDC049655 TaxID=3364355 RepID=UPI0037980E13